MSGWLKKCLALLLCLCAITGYACAESNEELLQEFVLNHGDRNIKKVAITVDDCYKSATEWIKRDVELCKEQGIVMTFFPLVYTGCLEEKYREMWQSVLDAGCEIGTHTNGVMIICNLFIRPLKYETLFVNNVFRSFLFSIFTFLILWNMLCVIYYQIVMGVLNASRTRERMRMLEMQESQFESQQQYMESFARTRHDFRQNILTMKNLYHEGNFEQLGLYIDEYYDALPVPETRQYCCNRALNALLNFYAGKAKENEIPVSFRIDIPQKISVSDIDLCTIIGNILENAVAASLEIPVERRSLLLSGLVQNNRLYIVATNSFSGLVRQRNSEYLSSRHTGSGIGLKSVCASAEKYHGKAVFSHNGQEFHSDVMLLLQPA